MYYETREKCLESLIEKKKHQLNTHTSKKAKKKKTSVKLKNCFARLCQYWSTFKIESFRIKSVKQKKNKVKLRNYKLKKKELEFSLS